MKKPFNCKGKHNNGVYSLTTLRNLPGYPSLERIKSSPVACIECGEEIPCNPCIEACPFSAISMGEKITALPELNEVKCRGCGLCVAACPGQAIFLLDYNYSKTKAAVSFPYEFLPLPEPGSSVKAVNREGKVVCQAEVIKVDAPEQNQMTAVVKIAIPKEYIEEVRFIERGGENV